jgi:hypothetical protein
VSPLGRSSSMKLPGVDILISDTIRKVAMAIAGDTIGSLWSP